MHEVKYGNKWLSTLNTLLKVQIDAGLQSPGMNTLDLNLFNNDLDLNRSRPYVF